MFSALKNFGVTFLIAALLFGIIGYFTARFVTSTVDDIMSDEQNELNEIKQNSDSVALSAPDDEDGDEVKMQEKTGDSISFVVITTDFRPDLYDDYSPSLDLMYSVDWDEIGSKKTVGLLNSTYRGYDATSIVYVRIDTEKKETIYTYFTPELRVFTKSGYHSLSEVYTLYGAKTVADRINSMTGLKVDYTFVINGYNIDELQAVLGDVTINNTKDIYADENGKLTTAIETTVERIGDDHQTWTEHIPNLLALPVGEISTEGDNLINLLSLRENGISDKNLKATLMISILEEYLKKIESMDYDTLRITLSQLIMKESEWTGIAGLNYVPAEPTETVNTDAEGQEGGAEENTEDSDSDVPFDTTPVDDVPFDTTPMETDEDGFIYRDDVQYDEEGNIISGEEGEGEAEDEEGEEETEEEEPKAWYSPAAEPDNPITETGFSLNSFEETASVIQIAAEYENVVISYPCNFYNTADGSYFDASLNEGLELYLKYRHIPKTDE